MNKKNIKNIIGLTLIEILIGIVITTIMMAAMYTSYNVVNQSYSKVIEKAKISKSSRDLVSMLMRDIRMSGFKYYAGHQQIKDFAEATKDFCGPTGKILPKLSNLYYEAGFDEPEHSHNPIVIRKNTLGKDAVTSEPSVTCCDQIQIVYDDFNQNDYYQPFKRYRITYYAKPNNEGSFAVYKRIESYISPNAGCSFSIQPETDDQGDTIPLTVADLRGNWEDRPREVSRPNGDQVRVCAVCTPGVMIRDHVEDMEFIPYDQNGRIIQEGGKFPAPDQGISTDLRAKLLDIRGVDIKLIFRSKEHFFKKAQARTVIGLSDRNLSTTDRYLRDSVIVSVYTRNIGGGF
tara:strand:+ start:1686 stop:2723 length:1038 start_codon:yes stop_codon:yes gene_type:complete